MFRRSPEPQQPTGPIGATGGNQSGPQAIAPPPPPRRALWRRYLTIRRVVSGVLLVLVLLVGWLAVTAPLSRSLRPIAPPSITLTAQDGREIARQGAIMDRPVDVRRLPAYVGNAFVAIEDRRFYRHWGIDPRGIARAAWHNLRSGGVREGGSTITQQLAKLVFLNSNRNFGRKAREVLIAFWMEAWLTKQDILSRYLSNAYFGDNVYGLRAAARHYFDLAPEDLSLGQAAMLAGLMKAPSKYAPSSNIAGARIREALVLAAMVDGGFIDAKQAAAVPTVRLRLRDLPDLPNGSYFADWVMPAARALDEEDAYAQRTVPTTLDYRLQRAAEAAARRGVPAGAQVALVAMRTDGRVVAMVGGRDYGASPFNRAVQARRQPGSTFKLFVYLAALRAGMTPDDEIEDKPITIDGWSPSNADGRYRGKITLREAFARSSNVAAARLAQQVGPDAVVQAARDLGIASPLNPDASIALGTSGVTLLELTSAYAAVAADAYPVRPRGLPDVQEGWFDRLRHRQHGFGGDQIEMLRDLLSATVRQGTGRAARLDRQVFGKTGTTQDNRDAIFVGFADGLVTAVWVGRDDNKPMRGIAGGNVPARIWRSFMATALGAHLPGSRPAVGTDPTGLDKILEDAGIGNFQLGNMSVDLHVDGDGVHVSAGPARDGGTDKPSPEPSGTEPPSDAPPPQ
ncbi:transglycosylase domain-containing protein [Flavisphingomonas formosensis]|uniref:transglycosylase domain-containing protein n=1 Tax=Flavisphingomonas formosensis TaxID=861534 RepID=UPI0012FAF076|nr:transglycosylase domain-containing protein [Sphingomonas formosensis]